MFIEPKQLIKPHIRPNEEVLWFGSKVYDKTVKTIIPILKLLFYVAMAFFGYGFILIIMDVLLNTPIEKLEQFRFQVAPENLKTIFFAFLGGGIFLLFWAMLPRAFENELDTVYAITTRRAFILIKDPETGLFLPVKEWGSGDVQSALKKMRGDSYGNLVFVEDIKNLGKNETGNVQRNIDWFGFEAVDDINGAFAALSMWKKTFKEKDTIANEKMGFSIAIPHDWNCNSYKLDVEERDNSFLSIISAEMVGNGRLMQSDKIDKEWNTLILTKKVNQENNSINPRHFYLTTIIDAVLVKELPKLGDARFSGNVKANFKKLVSNEDQFTEMIKGHVNIVEFNNLNVKDPKSGKLKSRIHAKAKKIDLKNDFAAFEMVDKVVLTGNGLKFKHIYAYKIIPWDENVPEMCLHVRFSFICTDKDKEKYYNANHKGLFEIAQTLKLLDYTPPE